MTHGGGVGSMRRNSEGVGGAVGGRRHTMPTQALRADVKPATQSQSCAGAPGPCKEWVLATAKSGV